jgi:hypothetical protein
VGSKNNGNMKRRSALKGLSALAIGVTLFPSCSDQLALDPNITEGLIFSEKQSMWIETISDAILPKEGLNLTAFETFPEFVSKMIPFEKPAEDQIAFVRGYNNCTDEIREMFTSNIDKVGPEQIIEYFGDILNHVSEVRIEDAEEAQIIADKSFFCKELRSLSIRHLTSSKEYQEGILEYQLVPGFYNACVPV